jgi:hypothetical protein
MADSIFSLSERDRAAFFQIAAGRIGRNAVLLEKDVWVVWALRTLFEDLVGAHLVFKGGTSLSKAHRLIERFSEDIDLTYDIRELAGDMLPKGPARETLDLPTTQSQARKITDEIRKERLPKWVKDTVAPVVQARLAKDGAKASIEINGCDLSIRYAKTDHGHVKSAVLLEFGARSTGEPADLHDIVCDSAAAGLAIDLPTAKARVMKAERTFWEKATAVHVFCRSGDPVGDHKARHWYDLERLDAKGISGASIADGIPFVDTGIGVGIENDCLDGCARATFIRPGTSWVDVEKLLPFGDDGEEDGIYRTDIQIAAVNSLNAIMAVLRWQCSSRVSSRITTRSPSPAISWSRAFASVVLPEPVPPATMMLA